MSQDTGELTQGLVLAMVIPKVLDPVLHNIERVRDADADQGGEDAEVWVKRDPELLQLEVSLFML